MTHNELKKYFTITINEYTFVPMIKEDDKYYYVEYIDQHISNFGFAITKQSHMGAIKRTMMEDIIKLLKEGGLL